VSSHVVLAEHLVALVQHEELEVVEVEILLLAELHHSSGSSNHDVGLLVALQDLDVFALGHSAVEHLGDHVGQILGESSDFFFDLVSQLTGVTQNQSGVRLGVLLQLLEDRNYENGGLSHSGHGLADNVSSDDRGRDALLLDLRRVFESAVDDGSVQLSFQKEILESGTMHSGVGSDSILVELAAVRALTFWRRYRFWWPRHLRSCLQGAGDPRSRSGRVVCPFLINMVRGWVGGRSGSSISKDTSGQQGFIQRVNILEWRRESGEELLSGKAGVHSHPGVGERCPAFPRICGIRVGNGVGSLRSDVMNVLRCLCIFWAD